MGFIMTNGTNVMFFSPDDWLSISSRLAVALLVGGVVGVRGSVGETVNYDVSLGTPIKKPEGFDTDTRVWAFRGSYQF